MFNIPKTYKLIEIFDLKDIESKGYLLKHVKSGAKIALIENDDDNKVFYVGFRTSPEDSTGVAHIIEHSVLCGSEKYPIKDPFVELAKGSLNTFLNAMTYPDKTVYPVASENDKDFNNLIDVYMDAVFKPNIYKDEKIFKQEGWHYEMTDPEGELTLNGVVYNEMKGALSTPDDLLERETLNSLFPDNTYRFESGGDPDFIPDLTYEGFLAFHKRFYHPSNSYIYLYGKMDFAEKLNYLDREYLSKYEKIDPKSEIAYQTPFESPRSIERDYPVTQGADTENSTFFTEVYGLDDILDRKLYEAFSVLDYALLNSPGAPIREALMKKGIGKDITGGFQNGTLQTYFSIGVKGASPKDKEKFHDIIRETLDSVVKNGIDKKAIRAAINVNEFNFREGDYGRFPKGLLYGLIALDSWLYDDNDPFGHLNALEVFDDLKAEVDTDYFEKLVEKYFVNNNYKAVITLNPKEGMGSEKEDKLKSKLEEYKSKLSLEEREKIVLDTKILKEFQGTPTSPEDLKKLPLLERSDLRDEIKKLKNRLVKKDGVDVLYHDIQSNGIFYLNMLFDLRDIPYSDISALSLYSKMLGLLDTKNYTYGELSNEINIKTGGISPSISLTSDKDEKPLFYLGISGKFLEEHIEDMVNLSLEMILDTKYEDFGRMREILNQEISHFNIRATSSAHSMALNRAKAVFSGDSYINELTNGIEYYEYLKDLDKNFDKKISEFAEKCKEFTRHIFRKGGYLISATGSKELTAKIEPFVSVINSRLSDEKMGEITEVKTLENIPRAYKTLAAVQFVARAGKYSDKYSYSGALMVLLTILSYEYLWVEVRVKGGAYGCMPSFTRDREVGFVSYRDPKLSETNEVFNKTYDFVKSFDCDERDMTKYVIGTISTIDTPKNPAQEGERSLSCYFKDLTEKELQKTRDEVLKCSVEDIRALAEQIKEAMDNGALCVFGSEGAIEKDKELFGAVETLN